MWSFFVPVQLLSLLLEALSCPDQGVQLSTLSCLEPVLIDPPPALIQQLEALVSRLLALVGSPVMVSKISYRRVLYIKICMFLISINGRNKTYKKLHYIIKKICHLITLVKMWLCLNQSDGVFFCRNMNKLIIQSFFIFSPPERKDGLTAVHPCPFPLPCTWGKTLVNS